MLASALARNPLAELSRAEQDLDWLFGNLTSEDPARADELSTRSVPVSLWASQEKVRAAVRAPGVDPDSIDVSVVDNRLTIRGELPGSTDREDVRWIRRERPSGTFARTIELPFAIDADNVEARFENGLLVIDLPRPERERPRRIQIGRGNS